jgi:hypothetical protein
MVDGAQPHERAGRHSANFYFEKFANSGVVTSIGVVSS